MLLAVLQSEQVHTRITEFSGLEYNGDRMLPHNVHTYEQLLEQLEQKSNNIREDETEIASNRLFCYRKENAKVESLIQSPSIYKCIELGIRER